MLVFWGLICADWRRAPQDGWTPLIMAARYDKIKVVRELLAFGADVEAKDKVIGGNGLFDAARCLCDVNISLRAACHV